MIRTRLRAKSAKRVKQDREYAKVRGAALQRDNFECQAAGIWMEHPHCLGRPEVHHVVSRARAPELACELTNLKTLCSIHHQFAHLYPAEATELGLLRSAGAPCPEAPR